MQLSLRPVFRPDAAAWLPRAASLVLFIALCALATRWVLTFSAMRTIPVPQAARVAQTEAVETGAVATLFGGSAQGGARDVQLVGVVADVADGAGAAIVSLDGGPPKAVRAGTALSSQIRLVEIHGRSVVIERNGVRQEIALPVQAAANRSGPPSLPATLPSGAAAPLATPMPPPAPAVSQAPSQPVQPTVHAAAQQPSQAQSQAQEIAPLQLQPGMAPAAPMAAPLVPKN
ncbi:general secretion pathway protein [Cupriavidus sp. UYMMa02A]|nr:general secretion pathway protein [Cupriavidus sp. UYMMa02A]